MLLRTLQDVIADVSVGIVENNLYEEEALNQKQGCYEIKPYHGLVNSQDDYKTEEGVKLTFNLRPHYITNTFPDVSFLSAIVGSESSPFRLRELIGRGARSTLSLEFLWTGKAQQDERNIPPDTLRLVGSIDQNMLNLDFKHACSQDFVCLERMDKTGDVFYTCEFWEGERKNIRPLIPFGIYMDPSFNLDNCFPVIGTLKSGEVTQLGLKPYQFWEEHGLSKRSPAMVGKYRYSLNPDAFDNRSLGARIRGGSLVIESEGSRYASSDFAVLDVKTNLVEITFL